jgi:hypothetical protein
MLTLYVTSDVDPNNDSVQVVLDDVVSLGDSSGPLGTNAASNLPVPIPSTVRTYNVPTDGITLGDLNAGNVYLWLGWKSWLTSAYTPASVSFTITPSSPVSDESAKVLDVTTNFSVTWDYPGTDPAYVIANLTGTAAASGKALPSYSTNYTGTVTVDNGLGATDSGSVQAPTPDPPPTSRSAGPTAVKFRINDDASQTVTMHSTTAIVGANQTGLVTHTLTAAAVAPSDATLNLTAVSLYAPDTGSSVLFGYPYQNSRRLPPLG